VAFVVDVLSRRDSCGGQLTPNPNLRTEAGQGGGLHTMGGRCRCAGPLVSPSRLWLEANPCRGEVLGTRKSAAGSPEGATTGLACQGGAEGLA